MSVVVPGPLYTPPPPLVAEFPLTVQSVSVTVPASLFTPPPLVAEFPLIVQSVSVTVPLLSTPPPASLSAIPSVIVRFESVAVAPVTT